MKITLIASLIVAALVPSLQAAAPPAVLATTLPRGGSAIGPLDADLAMKLSKTAATAYVASSASKYIAKATDTASSNLANFLTGDMFQLHALITTISCAMFKFSSEFDPLKSMSAFSLLAIGLKVNNKRSLDTLKDNAFQAVIAVALTVIAFVDF